jgi:hypothetical protein
VKVADPLNAEALEEFAQDLTVIVRSQRLTCAYDAQEEARRSGAEIASAGHNGRDFWFEAEFTNRSKAREFYNRMRRA